AYQAAMHFVGAGLSGILNDVVCHGESAAEWGARHCAGRETDALPLLRQALRMLAFHYGKSA
ncbi:MAG: hypothetical protein ACREQ5_10765, partial [Candidatus Dormibacteria bacterium]